MDTDLLVLLVLFFKSHNICNLDSLSGSRVINCVGYYNINRLRPKSTPAYDEFMYILFLIVSVLGSVGHVTLKT